MFPTCNAIYFFSLDAPSDDWQYELLTVSPLPVHGAVTVVCSSCIHMACTAVLTRIVIAHICCQLTLDT